MNAINRILVLGFLVLFQGGCSRGLTPDEYLRYFEKNKSRFTKKIERNGITATVAYIPVEYYRARDITHSVSGTKDSVRKRYENSLFFVFTIRGTYKQGGSALLERDGPEGFRNQVLRNTFEKNEDIFLLNGKDTVRMAGYRYDRNWGMGNDDSFIITFDKENLHSKLENYHLILREMVPELGTVDIRLKDVVANAKKLRGKKE